MALTQKLFCDIPVETVTILENASRIYPKILKSKKNVDKKTAQSISILLSILDGDSNLAKDLFLDVGFTRREIIDYFEIDGRYLYSLPVNIQLLSTEFGELIFGLQNKERKRPELNPFNICSNLFN